MIKGTGAVNIIELLTTSNKWTQKQKQELRYYLKPVLIYTNPII